MNVVYEYMIGVQRRIFDELNTYRYTDNRDKYFNLTLPWQRAFKHT